MTSIIDTPNIEKLIYDLYHNPSSQTTANQSLTKAQASREAWTFSWSFLSPSKPIEVQYFGASSLHLKISKYWSELNDNEEDKISLRNRLLEALVMSLTNQTGSRIVQTRLSVALASYVVHTVSNIWPTAIPDLITNISVDKLGANIPTNRIIHTLLEVLTMIPEEFHSLQAALLEKSETRICLLKFVPQVFGCIESVLTQQLPTSGDENTPFPTLTNLQQSSIKCFSNWTQHLSTLLIADEYGHERLLDLCLLKLQEEELVQHVVEAITTIYTHPEVHKYPKTVIKLINKLVSNEYVLDAAIEDENFELTTSLYSLFIQIAETHSRLLLDTVSEMPEQRDVISRLMLVVLKCAATPGHYPVDETVSEQSFNFFYILQDDIVASDEERAREYLQLFQPLYQKLIQTLLVKVQYPCDAVYENEWNADDKESFRCYRQDIGDTFTYCYNMLRSSVMSSLQSSFHEALANMINLTNTTASSITSTMSFWQPLEAIIFALTSVAENITGETEEECLTAIFDSLAMIPFSMSEKLLASTMEFVGSYCEWIFHHPLVLPRVLNLVLQGLRGTTSSTTVASTMALKDLTRECQLLIETFAPTILVACREGLNDSSSLKPKDKARLVCSIGQVLSVLPNDIIQSYLNELLPPMIERLRNCIQDTQPDRKFVVRNEAINQLNMIAMMFSSIDFEVRTSMIEDARPEADRLLTQREPNPLFPVFQQILPLLAEVGVKWIDDETVIEPLSECIKKAVLCLLDEVKPVVPSLLQLVTQLYVASSQPFMIDVIKQLIMLFYSDESMRLSIVSCFSSITSHTITVCQDMRNRTALIEHYYAIAASLVKKQSSLFQQNMVDNEGLFRLACSALILPEKPTVKSVTLFLSEFINKSRDSQVMSLIVSRDGEAVVTQVFVVIAGTADSPRNVTEYMADILVSLNQKYFDNLNRWMMTIVSREGFPSTRVTRENKENFVRLILREKKNKRRIKDLVAEFTLVCRGLVTTDYGMPAPAV